MLQFFAKSGFPCPCRRNPSDHFLRCINSDFDVVKKSFLESRGIRVRMRSHFYCHSIFVTLKWCSFAALIKLMVTQIFPSFFIIGNPRIVRSFDYLGSSRDQSKACWEIQVVRVCNKGKNKDSRNLIYCKHFIFQCCLFTCLNDLKSIFYT